jgi:hypothetical protein
MCGAATLSSSFPPPTYGICQIGPFTFSDGTVNSAVYGVAPSPQCTSPCAVYTTAPSS